MAFVGLRPVRVGVLAIGVLALKVASGCSISGAIEVYKTMYKSFSTIGRLKDSSSKNCICLVTANDGHSVKRCQAVSGTESQFLHLFVLLLETLNW